jgi:PAS domain S-box-containing protein
MSILPETSSVALARASATGALPSDVHDSRLAPPAALLSTIVAGPEQRRAATAAMAVSVIAFAIAVPFARTPLVPIPAFIPAYEAALVIIDLITAVLLFQQFTQQRPAALLVLAAGYLFDGVMTVAHALSFPGLITPTGWLGAGSQTTAWLYMFWHGGFPIFVMAYVGLARRASRRGAAGMGISAALVAVGGAVGLGLVLSVIATASDNLLPQIMAGNAYTSAMKFAVGMVWGLTAAALLVLILNRPYSLLDLWLIVVTVAWLADIGLSAVFNAGRFDLGFYAGRLYGLLAASFVLAVILVETGGLYRQLAVATAQLEEQARGLARRVQQRTEELTQANRLLSAILESSPVAIMMRDPDGKVVLWNAAAERIFGYSEEEALGQLPLTMIGEHAADFRAHLARAAADVSFSGRHETQRRRKDGSVIDVSARWARVTDEAGHLLGIMYAVADITERKKLENQLRQAQKMEAIGTLTGGLAHDFNNHLGVILLNLDILRERLPDDPDSVELADDTIAAATRGAELIRRLLAFARRQPLQPQATDVNLLVAEITKLLERTLGEGIKIRLQLDKTVWPTVIDPAQLESSLANLATNARDAMPNGGELTIATGNRELDEDYAAQHAEVTPGFYAMIEVSDSGSGMPPEVLAQVFEPFYTTKAPGKGTGLGLSMVYGFIKQSGGHINVYSEVGVGTIFRLYLPRADADADAQSRAGPAARELARGAGQTVLAVEDNPLLRRVVVRQLSEIGYRVIEAADTRAALDILEREAVEVLFTDVVLPGGTSGYELARAATARWPHLKVVLTSGFPENRIADNADLANVKLLSKPYRRDDIARVIREALQENVAGRS